LKNIPTRKVAKAAGLQVKTWSIIWLLILLWNPASATADKNTTQVMTTNPETLITVVQQLQAEIQELKSHIQTQVVPDVEMENDEEEPALHWDAVLPRSKTAAVSLHGKALSTLFHNPPPLHLVRSCTQESVKYEGVPETPAARKYGPDRQWQMVQQKLEHSMHALIHMIESDDKEQLKFAAASVRSAWEDCQHNRRCLIAGKDRSKLDPRKDDTRPMLLSKEEESKVHRPSSSRQLFPQTAPNQQYQQRGWGTWQPQQRSRSTSQSKPGKGQGKGKGKGRWQQK
jgi:hypothetical protein